MPSSSLPKVLLDQAASPYQSIDRFTWRFARGKLSGDPIFAALLQRGLIPSHARILDIGCGQGLLAALLGSLNQIPFLAQNWPATWSHPPHGVSVRGIELMPRDVDRARQALAHLGSHVEIVQGDMCQTAFEPADVAVILDVLHYVNYEAQNDVLSRVKSALEPNGTLLLRVGDASAGLPFKISNWVDAIVTFVRGHRLSRLYCRPLSEWVQLLTDLGFKVETLPMHKGTPFANILLVARLPAATSAS